MSDSTIGIKWMRNHEALEDIYRQRRLFDQLMDLSIEVESTLSTEGADSSILFNLLGQLIFLKHNAYIYTMCCDPGSYHNILHNRSREAHEEITEWREMLWEFRNEIASRRDILEKLRMDYWLDFAVSHDTAVEIMGGGSDLHIECVLTDFTYMWLGKWSDEESVRLEHRLISALNDSNDETRNEQHV